MQALKNLHETAAEHFEKAAHHHRLAAEHTENDEHEMAAHHAMAAHAHAVEALENANQASKQHAKTIASDKHEEEEEEV